MRISAILTAWAAAVVIGSGGAAMAQTPSSSMISKPVRIVVPGPPGGPAGALALFLATKMTLKLGQTVVVDHRPGAAGNIAIEHVARSAGDGYTLFFGVPALVTNPYFLKTSVDPRQLAPVIQLNSAPFLLLVNAKSELTSPRDVVARIKAQPGRVTCAMGAVALSTASCYLLQAYAGPMNLVAYGGNAQAGAAVERSEVDVLFDFINVAGAAVREGRLKALAVTSRERVPGELAALPPISETVPDFELIGWQGIMMPRDTPREIVMRYNTAFNELLAEEDVRKFFANANLAIAGGTPEAFGQRIMRDLEFYGRIAKDANIQPE